MWKNLNRLKNTGKNIKYRDKKQVNEKIKQERECN